ncbi:MAG: hypothetical protein ACE5H1_12120 [Thermodesulfobacteriota bacterium]
MEILKAVQIAKREWGNIKLSLELCGDIGEFDSKHHVTSRIVQISGGSLLVRNLIEMENKLPTYGYSTLEAAYVFAALVSRAGEKLGLIDRPAQIFGRGYSWVRTGVSDLNGIERQKHAIEQLMFFKIFYPHGEYFNWDFNSSVVKAKLNLIFNRFITWQLADSNEEYQALDTIEHQTLRSALSKELPESD